MTRTAVVTGSASGIGAATAARLRRDGVRVIGVDLREAEIIADLATPAGRAAMVDAVADLSDGRIDAVVANAGGGPAETSLSLNFYGAVATLEGLRPMLARGDTPRAVAISSVAGMRPDSAGLVDACLTLGEREANAFARRAYDSGELGRLPGDPTPAAAQAGLALYGGAKRALERWCRRAAPGPDWAGAGVTLNVIALGFFDTPAAAFMLGDPQSRAAVGQLAPLAGAFPGKPEEAAAAIAWCVGPENSQMTGQVLYLDAGIECRGRAEAGA
jgi:NAD(P)-dependent dehydrogenase (short-subunit alcohol dehydrogenase family)